MEKLPVQIAEFHRVGVTDSDSPHARKGKVHRGRAAQSPGAGDKRLGISQPLLGFNPPVWDDQLPLVAVHFLLGVGCWILVPSAWCLVSDECENSNIEAPNSKQIIKSQSAGIFQPFGHRTHRRPAKSVTMILETFLGVSLLLLTAIWPLKVVLSSKHHYSHFFD